jgi:hypothetical protein
MVRNPRSVAADLVILAGTIIRPLSRSNSTSFRISVDRWWRELQLAAERFRLGLLDDFLPNKENDI